MIYFYKARQTKIIPIETETQHKTDVHKISEDVKDVFLTSHVHSIYVLGPGG